jgi:hypothetical protein
MQIKLVLVANFKLNIKMIKNIKKVIVWIIYAITVAMSFHNIRNSFIFKSLNESRYWYLTLIFPILASFHMSFYFLETEFKITSFKKKFLWTSFFWLIHIVLAYILVYLMVGENIFKMFYESIVGK